MHTEQKHFIETEANVKDFISVMKMKLMGRNLDDVLNMDQMPIPFSYHSNKMLDLKGSKMIHTRASTTDTSHTCCYSHCKWKNVDTIHYLQRCQMDIFHCGNLDLILIRENMHARRRPGWMNPR
jgi:hypothetical protein